MISMVVMIQWLVYEGFTSDTVGKCFPLYEKMERNHTFPQISLLIWNHVLVFAVPVCLFKKKCLWLFILAFPIMDIQLTAKETNKIYQSAVISFYSC